MKIAMIEMYAGDRSATGERARAIEGFLTSRGHHVETLAPTKDALDDFARFRFSLWSRLKRRALRRRTLPHLWDYLADELEPRVRAGNYDVVMARLQPVSYVLTRDLDCIKIFDMANIGFLELYHSWGADMSEIEIDYRKEMEVYRAADHVFMHHQILTDFFRKHVYDDDKVRAVRMGCHAAARIASYSENPKVVYAGSYSYIQDPYLLSLLSRRSPYPVHCYGGTDPNYSFLPARLDYKGYAERVDFMADYQFGLITISRDLLRRHSPSTKFAYYFAHGLPVFFPDWMEEGHTYDAAIPYSEENFEEQVRRYGSDRATWEALSKRALEIADSLRWDRVLAPLEELLP